MIQNYETITCDVLVIGGGSSGMWCAARLKERDANCDVLIVDKGPKDMGGLMAMCGGDMDVVMPGEDVEDWVEDLTWYWDGLCDQNELTELLSRSYDRFQDYVAYGCRFFKNPDGSYKSIPQRGLPHCKLYPAAQKGTGGHDMVQGILGRIRQAGVRRMGRTMISDIIMEDGRPTGAVGFDVHTGAFLTFRARAILMASGQAEWKPAYSQNTATGEGMEMAFRAGVKMRNFEFLKVWNVPRDFTWEGQTTLLPLGAHFINAKGERIMDRYLPGLGSNTDPHYVTRAMALEVNAGRGPIYLDTGSIREEDKVLLVPQTGWQLVNYQKLQRMGMDMFSRPTVWVPHVQDTCGGICTDLYGRTNIPGIFAAGRCRSIDPGVYIGGFAMCTTAVTGYMTGDAIADFLAEAGPSKAPNEARVADCRRALFAPLGTDGLLPSQVLDALREIIFPYDVCILKSEASLSRALDQLQTVKDGAFRAMAAPDTHYLLKYREVIGMTRALELYLRASLERRESRAGHFRVDYPGRDERFLAWLEISGGERGAVEFTRRLVPTETYRHPVNRFYSDQFRMDAATIGGCIK